MRIEREQRRRMSGALAELLLAVRKHRVSYILRIHT